VAEEPAIVYSVKELISRLDGKLDAIMNVLTNKADRADVTALERRQDVTEGKVSGLETRETEREKRQDDRTLSKRAVIGIIVAISTSLLSAAVSLFIAFHK
jgi:hypothetical protein